MSKNLKVAIMGGGNSAHTMAADIALSGLKVNLCDLPSFKENIRHVMETGQIEKVGSAGTIGRTGIAKLNKITTDVAEAIKGMDIVMLAVPAYGHMAFFKALAENLKDGQIVVILPGNWGAIRFFNLLKNMGLKKNVIIAETDRCMHFCRAAESWLGPGKARVILEQPVVQIAAMPTKDTQIAFEIVKTIYPQLTLADNVLETSLNNSNIVIHGPLVLMNTGWIEHTKGQFMIYRDGTTPSIGRIVDAIGDERDSIIQKLGFKPSYREPFYRLVKDASWPKDPCETGPPNLQHRYLTEDIPFGLVPLAYLGDLLDVHTPICDAVIELSSKVNNIEYWKQGLSLKKLGLDGFNAKKILKFVNEGN